MRDEGRRSVVQVMNIGEKDFVLRQGEFIGEAEPVITVNNGERIAKPPEGAHVLSEEAEVSTERPVIELDREEGRGDAASIPCGVHTMRRPYHMRRIPYTSIYHIPYMSIYHIPYMSIYHICPYTIYVHTIYVHTICVHTIYRPYGVHTTFRW